MTLEGLFFELLKVTVGNRSQLSVVPTSEEWMALRRMADKQSLTGIVLHGVEKLPTEQRPPQNQLLDWIGQSMIIRERNRRVSEVCNKLVTTFAQAGFDTCILKGQANHIYYGEELGLLRVCGDVDIWAVPKERGCKKTEVRRILDYVYNAYSVESLCWLHIELKPIETVPIEVHLRPSFFNSPIRNRRFIKYIDFEKAVSFKEVDGIELPTLKKAYDLFFQMNHIYRHLLDEGIGLRQVVDYYYLLMSEEKCPTIKIDSVLKSLGMLKFASALMYVMKAVLGMKRELMICEPSEKDGLFLLNEILMAGNFGHYDIRLKKIEENKSYFSFQIKRAKRRMERNLRFLRDYPEEVVWEPITRVYHYLWKLRYY